MADKEIQIDARQLSGMLGKRLQERGWTMGAAESCTGGRIASLLTAISGSSAYFSGGIISYSNEVKQRLLGVSASDLETYGAVSEPVVRQMVTGAQRVLDCDCAVATSGIAGPTGGTPEKPVGTVWIAAAVKEHVLTELHHFDGDREDVMSQAANTALELLCNQLNRVLDK